MKNKTYSIKHTVLSFVLGIALMFGVVIQPAHAQTSSALQAQIQALLAQITLLQAQLAGQGVASAVCPYTWTRSFSIGSTGADVLKLQQFLNSDPATRIAISGAGSPGMETQYYGALTAAAVSKFQTKYRAEILSPVGLVNPTGYFGPSTIGKANALCRTAPVVVPPVVDDEEEEEKEDDNALRGDEAYFDRFKVSSGEDTNLEEGQKDARVMEFEFKVEEGDVRINRIDLAFEHILGDEDEPWETFDEVTIWDGNKRIARATADQERNWSEDAPYNGAYRLRISGIDYIVREGDTAELTVGVTLQNSIDGANNGLSWDVLIPDEGIRARDAEGLTQYTGDTSRTVNFDINEEGYEDELAIRSSSDDPDASTLQVDRDTRSDWHTVFAFDLDTDDSRNDIEIREIPVSLIVSTSTVGTFLNDARLVINGEEYDDVTIVDGIQNYMVFEIDRDDLIIDAGDRVTAELEVEFKPLAQMYEGVTIQGTASSTNIIAEGADDLEANQLSGASTGDEHVLRTTGANFSLSNTSATVDKNVGDDLTDDEGVFSIKFNVTAFESDIYVNRSATSGTALGTAGVNFLIEDSVGDPVATGTVRSSLSSNASVSGGRYHVPEGTTKTFTLSVTFDPVTSGFYRAQLYSLNFATDNTDPTDQQRVLPESRYETDPVSI